MNAFVSHPSVRIRGTENNYEPSNCVDPKCSKAWPHLHCPFCVKSEFFQDPVILKAHYRVKHVDKGIEFAGLRILRCCEQCDIVGTIKGTKEFKGAHWHCYKCRNGFTRRDEAIKHYKTHFRNPSTTFQIQVAQDITQPTHFTISKDVSNAVDSLPQEMTLIETVVTTAAEEALENSQSSVTEEQMNSEDEKSSSGEIQVPVAANETVGTCEGQNVVYIPTGEVVRSIELDNTQDLETILKQYNVKTVMKTPTSSPPSSTIHWRREKSMLEQQVKELKAHVAQLKTEKAHMEHHLQEEIKCLKHQLQAAASEVGASQKRETELLSNLKIPLDGRVNCLLRNMKHQHEELLHQQLSQLRQAYLQQQFGEDFETIQKSPPAQSEMDAQKVTMTVDMASLVQEQTASTMSEIMASVDGGRSVVTLNPGVYRSLPNNINAESIVLSTQSLIATEGGHTTLMTEGGHATLMTEGDHPTQLFVVPHEQTLHEVKTEVLEHGGHDSDDLSHEYHESEATATQLDYGANEDVTTDNVDMDHKMILLESTVGGVGSQAEYSQSKTELHMTLEGQEDLEEQTNQLADTGDHLSLEESNKRKLEQTDFTYSQKLKQSKPL